MTTDNSVKLRDCRSSIVSEATKPLNPSSILSRSNECNFGIFDLRVTYPRPRKMKIAGLFWHNNGRRLERSAGHTASNIRYQALFSMLFWRKLYETAKYIGQV